MSLLISDPPPLPHIFPGVEVEAKFTLRFAEKVTDYIAVRFLPIEGEDIIDTANQCQREKKPNWNKRLVRLESISLVKVEHESSNGSKWSERIDNAIVMSSKEQTQ